MARMLIIVIIKCVAGVDGGERHNIFSVNVVFSLLEGQKKIMK